MLMTRCALTVGSALVFVAGTTPAVGQQAPAQAGGVVAGQVIDQRTQQPIPEARVGPLGGLAVLTDPRGQFRLANVTQDTLTLQVQKVGYALAQRHVRVGATDLRIELSAALVSLNQVVVTGTAGSEEKRALGTSVATIDAAAVVQTAPVADVTELLNGRAAGVDLQPSGLVGGGARIRIRGVSSLSLTDEPLIYVDGVRIDNSAGTGPDNQSTGAGALSRVNDIDPDEIASIEIVRGPAAATLYGTQAENGVLQIITKHGLAGGAPQWDVTVREGGNWVPDPAGVIGSAWAAGPTGVPYSINFVDRLDSLKEPAFHTGQRQDYLVDLRGGSPSAQYYIGGGVTQNVGAETGNSARTTTGRSNLILLPSSKLKISASVGYTDAATNLPGDAGFGGPVWALETAQPTLLGTVNDGWLFGSPGAWSDAFYFTEAVQHLTGSVQLENNPTSWFTHRLTLGLDEVQQQDTRGTPFLPDSLQSVFGAGIGAGGKNVTLAQIQNTTLDYVATATARLDRHQESRTSAGFQYYQERDVTRQLAGSEFPAPGLSSVAGAAFITVPVDDFVQNNEVGGFLQEQWSLNNRLFVTAAARVDNNSAFGSRFKLAVYPKASATWVLSDEPFWSVPWFNTFRLRAAYGASGQQPAAFSALRTYLPSVGGGGIPVLTPGALGNNDLKPERTSEFEAGFDAAFLHDRIGLEYTHYAKSTSDAIVDRVVAPSSGFVGAEPFNVGQLRNFGDELTARATPIAAREAVLDLTLTVSRNNSRVVSVGATPFVSLNNAYGEDIRAVSGLPLGAWYGQKVVSAQFDGSNNPINVLCADGTGGGTSCDNAPEINLGSSLPTYYGSFSPALTVFKNLRISALLDWSGGNKMLDADLTEIHCRAFTANSIGTCRQVYFPAQYGAPVIAAIQQGIETSYGLSPGGFTKLREVSVTWTARRVARFVGASAFSVTIAGRNLATWTRYSGDDPEATTIATPFNVQTYAALPPLRSVVGTLHLTY